MFGTDVQACVPANRKHVNLGPPIQRRATKEPEMRNAFLLRAVQRGSAQRVCEDLGVCSFPPLVSSYDSRMQASHPPASIIVPTYMEQPNIRPLVERVFSSMSAAGIGAELIIVDDDSKDGTEETVTQLQSHHPVRIIARREERGLSRAVLAGFAVARHDRFVVLDGDLQHPPEMIPALLAHLEEDDCDFVIGTRYGAGGSVAEEWPMMRRLVSASATLLARPLAPLSDPMSGFFAIRRATWEGAAKLDPIGYKIALELYVKGGCTKPREVPIRFAARVAGTSKLSFAEQIRYIRHLAKLYRFRFPWVRMLAWSVILAVILIIVVVFLI